MCGRRAPSLRTRVTDPGIRPSPSVRSDLIGALEQQLHPKADPENRRPSGGPLREQPRRGRAPGCAPFQRETHRRPGARARRRCRSCSRSRVMQHAGADMLERLLDRAPVAHAVVDHRDRRPGRGGGSRSTHVSVPFVLGTPSVRRVDARPRGGAATGERLEHRLDHVVDVAGRRER